ncbi:MAG: phage holin family protein [Rubrivivax sp.]|nr:MAG: phage holin family protein [Rubrivivax sp.]
MNDSTTPAGPPTGGLLSSTRSLLATLLAIFHTRLELLTTELEEEKLRLLKVLAWGAVALMLGGMGILFIATFAIVLFWEDHRLLAVGLVAALFGVCCAVALARVKRHWQAATGLLSATLAELEQDRQALMPSSSSHAKEV